MSKLRSFIDSAEQVAQVQQQILGAMETVFSQDEYPAMEALILAPGYEGWEHRAISLVKSAVNENWTKLQHHVAEVTARYKNPLPYPGQSKEYWVDPLTKPHLRVYWCLRCGFQVTHMALSGICCHGQPKCDRCKYELHEEGCKRKATPPAKEPS